MIPFSPPKIYQELIDEVVDTLKSGWITTGPKTKQLEKNLADYCGVSKALCQNSATAGLELALRWFGVQEGDEVIVPAYTYCATANVVVHCGAKPVIVDVNPDDFNISIDQIKKAITPRTKVIMPVDLGGLPCDYDSIFKITQDYKTQFKPNNEVQKKMGRILILADAAHSLGATYKQLKIGAVADLTVFSFHAVKNLTTAEGGAVLFNLPEIFNSEELYQEFNVRGLHGQNKDALAKTKKGGWRYDVVEAGYKTNMTDIQAAMGLVELKYYDKETLVRRKQIYKAYNEAFTNVKLFQLPISKDQNRESSYHLYPLRIKGITETQRDKIIEKITEKGVSVNVHFQPLPMLSVYKNRGYNISNFPVAFDNYSREISLPVYFDLTDEQLHTVVNAVLQSIEEVIHA